MEKIRKKEQIPNIKYISKRKKKKPHKFRSKISKLILINNNYIIIIFNIKKI